MATAELVLWRVGSRAIDSQTGTGLHGLDVWSSLLQSGLLHTVVIGGGEHL
jgi:hypothetical protein